MIRTTLLSFLLIAPLWVLAKPNIIYIMADDLGYADVGCYGQTKIRTPHIDRLASAGMRFTQFYSGSPICAPSRCTVLTGLHTGHAQVRDNLRSGPWELGLPHIDSGQFPLAEGTTTISGILQEAGYATAYVGKWGLGKTTDSGAPLKQGFDHFFGYICQRQAHTHYPEFLWENDKVLEIPENFEGKNGRHSHDMMTEAALAWLEERGDGQPFFLYLGYAIPHVSIQASPETMAEYEGEFPEPNQFMQPKSGGYFSHNRPRTGYAAMVHMLDRDVGRVLDLLGEKGWERDTLVVFTSDNGPTYNGGTDSAFFGSAGHLGGLKTSVLEGGIRVPFIVRWPAEIERNTVSDHVGAFWDLLPTFAEVADAAVPEDIDGLSFLAALTGQGEQARHEYLYWELSPQRALRAGDWKLVVKPRNPMATRQLEGSVHLFNLAEDPGETKDLVHSHPARVAQLRALLEGAHTPNPNFPLATE